MTDSPAVLCNLIGDGPLPASTDRFDPVYNPSTGHVIAQVPLSSSEDTHRAVHAARTALPRWQATPVIDRARVMFRYRELLLSRFEELAATITREHGKTLAESRAEVQRGIEVVEFACGIPSLIAGSSIANIAADVDADVMRHPVGVCVGITPYNFPAMVPMWMFPIALTCGNTFILKPSEKTPLSALLLGELLLEAGLPPGVFNVLLGDRACVEALISHPDVAAVSFVGSTPVARAIYQQATSQGKRAQCAGGAKNHFLIMPDADMHQTVKALSAAAYGCAGQRCMATSVAVPVGTACDELVTGLVEHAKSLNVGATSTDAAGTPSANTGPANLDLANVDIGPLIRREHVERVSSYLDIARQDGAEIALDGRRDFESTGFLLGPSVVDRVQPEMRIARDEIFGPVLSVIRSGSLDEALALGRRCEFGNGASIFTRSGFAARQFREHFNAGMIGVNVGVPAPMAWFPFTGWNSSFFGDLHVQGLEGIQFYTRQKVTLTRWFASPDESHEDPVWRSNRQ